MESKLAQNLRHFVESRKSRTPMIAIQIPSPSTPIEQLALESELRMHSPEPHNVSQEIMPDPIPLELDDAPSVGGSVSDNLSDQTGNLSENDVVTQIANRDRYLSSVQVAEAQLSVTPTDQLAKLAIRIVKVAHEQKVGKNAQFDHGEEINVVDEDGKASDASSTNSAIVVYKDISPESGTETEPDSSQSKSQKHRKRKGKGKRSPKPKAADPKFEVLEILEHRQRSGDWQVKVKWAPTFVPKGGTSKWLKGGRNTIIERREVEDGQEIHWSASWMSMHQLKTETPDIVAEYMKKSGFNEKTGQFPRRRGGGKKKKKQAVCESESEGHEEEQVEEETDAEKPVPKQRAIKDQPSSDAKLMKELENTTKPKTPQKKDEEKSEQDLEVAAQETISQENAPQEICKKRVQDDDHQSQDECEKCAKRRRIMEEEILYLRAKLRFFEENIQESLKRMQAAF
jgi:hypothetical protein